MRPDEHRHAHFELLLTEVRGNQPPMKQAKHLQQLEIVVIRIAGDSGDGMQLTGDRFTQETAMFGNDLATFPKFPAEIRAS